MAKKRSILTKLVLVAGILGAWMIYSNPSLMYKLSTGQVTEITKEVTRRVGESIKSDVGSAVNKTAEKIGGPQTVYKWKDRNGKWHYSSEPPVNIKELDVTVQEIDPNTNTIPSGALTGPAPLPSSSSSSTSSGGSVNQSGATSPTASSNSDDPVSVTSYKEALEKAKEARELMEQRNKEVDKLVQ